MLRLTRRDALKASAASIAGAAVGVSPSWLKEDKESPEKAEGAYELAATECELTTARVPVLEISLTTEGIWGPGLGEVYLLELARYWTEEPVRFPLPEVDLSRNPAEWCYGTKLISFTMSRDALMRKLTELISEDDLTDPLPDVASRLLEKLWYESHASWER
jgi:hypothetical protein